VEKSTFNEKKTPFTGKLDVNLREKVIKYCTWNVALFATEDWILWKVSKQ
jgi:hypothetical protein